MTDSVKVPDRHPSRTAVGVARMRAAHQLLDGRPLILDDPVALQLLGPTAAQEIRDASERHQSPEGRALRSHMVLRSRFAEDRLLAAVRRGVTQYVILGAGFDTFAYRQPEWAQELSIIEVDSEATQAVKHFRLAEAGIAIPDNVRLVNVDFERESLHQGLERQHLALNHPTFFSWLGVTMYLTEEAIDAVLRDVARFPAGSEIVFTFAQFPEATPAGAPKRGAAALADAAAHLGEPWLSFFDPAVMETKLRAAGFSAVEFLLPEVAFARYFSQRPRDLPVPKRVTIVSAVR